MDSKSRSAGDQLDGVAASGLFMYFYTRIFLKAALIFPYLSMLAFVNSW